MIRAMVIAVLHCAGVLAQHAHDLTTACPLPRGATLAVGFLGGVEHWNDEHRSVRKLVLEMRTWPGVSAEVIENRRRRMAIKLIRRALDTNRNGRLEPSEKANARIILFGQSLGGAAAIDTARDLRRMGIPVMLTIQVDSVGVRDGVIPDNVEAAVNFFQHDPFTIWGRREIHAANPARTRILGNFASTYITQSPGADASWARRTFGGSHAKMEADPEVWGRVRQYIKDAVPR